MRTRAKQKHVASDRARRENCQRHILFHAVIAFKNHASGKHFGSQPILLLKIKKILQFHAKAPNFAEVFSVRLTHMVFFSL